MGGILSDPLDVNGPRRRSPVWPKVAANRGLVVRHRSTGTVGAVIRFAGTHVTLRANNGREHIFPVSSGAFSVKGQTVNLVAPTPKPETKPLQTASGSIAVTNHKARVARASRILVEGRHDAELVERVWGDDLRVEGVVVEPLHGADDLAAVVTEFGPTADQRLGILLDHYIPGTKEWRLAAEITDPNVLITGHPYVDVWEAIRPSVLGLQRWPTIERGTDWKTGMCTKLGFPGTAGEFWATILGRVSTFRDLESGLVGAVEQLIDFVAPPVDY